MKLHLTLEQPHARAWLQALAETLAGFRHDVTIGLTEAPSGPVRRPPLLLRIEPWLYGVSADRWLKPCTTPPVAAPAADAMQVSLAAAAPADSDFRVTVENEPVSALPDLLSRGLCPRLILTHRDGRTWMALPASERPFSLAHSLDSYVQRLALLIHKGVSGHPTMTLPPAAMHGGRHHLAMACRHFGSKLLGKAWPRRFRQDHWNLGIRRRPAGESDGLPQTLEAFRWIADDGASYLADPILWQEEDRIYLFVEVFPLDSQKGYLAVMALDETGMPASALQPVMMREGHLSYPFLFRHAGATYMIPENAAEGHLPLFRAKRFPDEWEPCGALLDFPLEDATLFAHEGRFWLLGNERFGGSSWDCLSAFHADNPLGPYTPHPANPLIIDARQARSAGPILLVDGVPCRPVQDCLGGYGMALQLAAIRELSPHGYAQQLNGRLAPGPEDGISGIHTYSRTGGLEAVDALTSFSGRLAREPARQKRQ